MVEDEKELLKSVVKYLTLAGYDVTGVSTAKELYKHLDEHHFDIAVLDIGLPDQSGLVLAEYLRKNTCIRIVMLTALSTIDDKLAGHNAGADVYLVKPFDCRELAAVIASLISRVDDNRMIEQQPRHTPQIEATDGEASVCWALITNKWLLRTTQGESVKLTPKEFALVKLLVSKQKEVVSRFDLLINLGYIHNESGNRALDALITRLRHKIEAVSSESPIQTSHGNGFCFIADILVK